MKIKYEKYFIKKKRNFDVKVVPGWFNLKENLYFKIDSS